MAYGYSADNIFTAIINENGDIFEASTGRQRQKVGVDSQREQELLTQMTEMQSVIDNYYDKLIELGAIVPPKTPDQIASEQLEIAQEQSKQQAQINESLLTAIKDLQSEIRRFKDGNSRHGDESSNEPKRQDSADDRKVSGTGKGSNRTGKKDAPGDSKQ